jgi:hypothetical protein
MSERRWWRNIAKRKRDTENDCIIYSIINCSLQQQQQRTDAAIRRHHPLSAIGRRLLLASMFTFRHVCRRLVCLRQQLYWQILRDLYERYVCVAVFRFTIGRILNCRLLFVCLGAIVPIDNGDVPASCGNRMFEPELGEECDETAVAGMFFRFIFLRDLMSFNHTSEQTNNQTDNVCCVACKLMPSTFVCRAALAIASGATCDKVEVTETSRCFDTIFDSKR